MRLLLLVGIFAARAVRDGNVRLVAGPSCQSQRFKDDETIDGTGYKVLTCLGKGFDGEAYLVNQINTGTEHILKIGGSAGPGIGMYECEFGKAAKQKPALKDHVTDCTDHGEPLREHPEKVTFIVMEKAPGKLLADVVMGAVDKPPKEFPDLPALLCTISDLVELNTQLVENKFFHEDLHLANLFLTPDKTLVAIDYGRTSREDDQENTKRRKMAGVMFWNVLAMLVQPTAPGLNGLPNLLMQILQNGAESRDGTASQTAHEIKQLMRDAYDISRLPKGDGMLTEALRQGFTKGSYDDWPPLWVQTLKTLQEDLLAEQS